eukprot:5539025-Pleurochrysis_carterae.AAC.2
MRVRACWGALVYACVRASVRAGVRARVRVRASWAVRRAQDATLDGRAEGDDLVGVDALERILAEEGGDGLHTSARILASSRPTRPTGPSRTQRSFASPPRDQRR